MNKVNFSVVSKGECVFSHLDDITDKLLDYYDQHGELKFVGIALAPEFLDVDRLVRTKGVDVQYHGLSIEIDESLSIDQVAVYYEFEEDTDPILDYDDLYEGISRGGRITLPDPIYPNVRYRPYTDAFKRLAHELDLAMITGLGAQHSADASCCTSEEEDVECTDESWGESKDDSTNDVPLWYTDGDKMIRNSLETSDDEVDRFLND